MWEKGGSEGGPARPNMLAGTLAGHTPVLKVLYVFPLNGPHARSHNFGAFVKLKERFAGAGRPGQGLQFLTNLDIG